MPELTVRPPGARPKVAYLGEAAEAVREVMRRVAADRYEVEFAADGSAAALLAAARQADFAIAGAVPVGAETFAAAPAMRMVHKFGIGVDKIDLAAAAQAGVVVAITAGVTGEWKERGELDGLSDSLLEKRQEG